MVAEHAFNDNVDPSDNDSKLRPGRPRSLSARKSILNATRRLLTQVSMSELSIEAVAKKAGVGKTTIYRWWPSKAAIAMEAFLEQPGLQHILPTTSTALEAIQKQLESLVRQLRGQNGRIIAGIVAEGQSSQEALDLLYEKFLKERVETLFKFIELGKIGGEIVPTLSTDIAVDMIMGPLFLRVLSGEHGIDNDFAEHYPAQAVLALKAKA